MSSIFTGLGDHFDARSLFRQTSGRLSGLGSSAAALETSVSSIREEAVPEG